MVTFELGTTRQQKIAILSGGDSFWERGLFPELSDEFVDALGPICLDEANEFDPEVLQRVIGVWCDGGDDLLIHRLQQCADPSSGVTWALIVRVAKRVSEETSLQCMVPHDLADKRLGEVLKSR